MNFRIITHDTDLEGPTQAVIVIFYVFSVFGSYFVVVKRVVGIFVILPPPPYYAPPLLFFHFYIFFLRILLICGYVMVLVLNGISYIGAHVRGNSVI